MTVFLFENGLPDAQSTREFLGEDVWQSMDEDFLGGADADTSGKDCYFVGGDGGTIKIGYSKHASRRADQLRWTSGRAVRLLAVAPGGRQREQYYHWLFGEHQVDGEWFAPHPDILAEIERLAA